MTFQSNVTNYMFSKTLIISIRPSTCISIGVFTLMNFSATSTSNGPKSKVDLGMSHVIRMRTYFNLYQCLVGNF